MRVAFRPPFSVVTPGLDPGVQLEKAGSSPAWELRSLIFCRSDSRARQEAVTICTLTPTLYLSHPHPNPPPQAREGT